MMIKNYKIKYYFCYILIFLSILNNLNKSFSKEDLKVSVVIPVYNSEKFLKKAIKSVINQTYSNLEIIVIDDFSKDKSTEIIEKFAKLDGRIKFIKNEQNLGVSATRNKGIKFSTGDYIYFFDSDDYLDKGYIKEFIKYAKMYDNPDILIFNNVIIFSHFYTMLSVYSNNLKTEAKVIDNKKMKVEEFGYANWNKMFKSELVKTNNSLFPENINYAEDQCFNVKNLLNAENIIIVNNVNKYHYRKSKNSLSDIEGKDKLYSVIKVFNYYVDYLIANHNNTNISLNLNLILAVLKNKKNINQSDYKFARNLFIKNKELILDNKQLYNAYALRDFNNVLKFDKYNDFLKYSFKLKIITRFYFITFIVVFLFFVKIIVGSIKKRFRKN